MDAYMDEYYENIDEFDISDLLTESERTAIVAEAKSCYDNLNAVSSKFFEYLDSNVPKAISKLKSAPNETKIKMKSSVKKAIEQINKETPDMLNDVKKYSKPTKFGKVASKAAVICGWTIPPLIPIPGASEILFASSEILNFLMEFQRRWSGANRSAINDFIVSCSKMQENITVNTVNQEKTCNNAIKLFRYMKTVLSELVDSTMIALRGNILKGYKQVYKGAEKAGKAIDNATKDSKSRVSKKVNSFGKKLNTVSSELVTDSQKAIDRSNELKAIKKEQKAKKKEIKTEAKHIAKSVNSIEKGRIYDSLRELHDM